MIFNTHTHLNDKKFNDNYKEVIEKSLELDMKLVVVGYDLESSIKAIKIAEEFQGVYAAVGLHPVDSVGYSPVLMKKFEDLLTNQKVIAIGECGLDYHWDTCPKDIQKLSFEYQIKMSKKFNLPLIVHSRDALEDTYNMLSEHAPINGIMHCYAGSAEMVDKFLEIGMYISLAGPVTFKNARMPKEVAIKVPLDKLLVETDCPYLTPHPLRGKENRPYYVTYVIDEISRLREITSEEVSLNTYDNAIRVFNIKE